MRNALPPGSCGALRAGSNSAPLERLPRCPTDKFAFTLIFQTEPTKNSGSMPGSLAKHGVRRSDFIGADAHEDLGTKQEFLQTEPSLNVSFYLHLLLQRFELSKACRAHNSNDGNDLKGSTVDFLRSKARNNFAVPAQGRRQRLVRSPSRTFDAKDQRAFGPF